MNGRNIEGRSRVVFQYRKREERLIKRHPGRKKFTTDTDGNSKAVLASEMFQSSSVPSPGALVGGDLILLVAISKQNCRDSAMTQLQGQTLEGSWEGVLVVGSAKLRLVLKISRSADGALKATVDSLDQPGGTDLKVDTITFTDGSLHFEMKDL
jgi:hypothetical protein